MKNGIKVTSFLAILSMAVGLVFGGVSTAFADEPTTTVPVTTTAPTDTPTTTTTTTTTTDPATTLAPTTTAPAIAVPAVLAQDFGYAKDSWNDENGQHDGFNVDFKIDLTKFQNYEKIKQITISLFDIKGNILATKSADTQARIEQLKASDVSATGQLSALFVDTNVYGLSDFYYSYTPYHLELPASAKVTVIDNTDAAYSSETSNLTVTPQSVKVSTSGQLATALANPSVTAIELGADITTDYAVQLSTVTTLQGNGHTLTLNGAAQSGAASGLGISANATVSNVTITTDSLADNLVEVFGAGANATLRDVTIQNSKQAGLTALNGANVNLTGELTLTGNAWGGIEVAGTSIVRFNGLGKLSYTPGSKVEAPVAWVDQPAVANPGDYVTDGVNHVLSQPVYVDANGNVVDKTTSKQVWWNVRAATPAPTVTLSKAVVTGAFENKDKVNTFLSALWSDAGGSTVAKLGFEVNKVFTVDGSKLTITVDKVTDQMKEFINTNYGGSSVPVRISFGAVSPLNMTPDPNWDTAYLIWVDLASPPATGQNFSVNMENGAVASYDVWTIITPLPVGVDKTTLTKAIDAEVGEYRNNLVYNLTESDYTEASWLAYKTAIEAAISVEGNAGATQTEVDDAQVSVATAKSGLVSMDGLHLISTIDSNVNNILLVGDYAFYLNDEASNYNINNFLVAAHTAYADPAGTYHIYFRLDGNWYDLVSAPNTPIQDVKTINGDGIYKYLNMH